MNILENINTEKRNHRSLNIDSMSIAEAVSLMIDEEYGVIEAIKHK
ncbi:N-acetylmuramic acid 6-phosphate etherase, partial [Francisella tularensis subsp. holarctica]|nr:N-acetylmuramic acid 6-phosphate etherase [Francisella tularensis subsp. holarctica]